MGQPQYSDEFKKAAVKKLLSRGSRTVGEISKQVGVSPFSLYGWSKQYGNGVVPMPSSRKPSDWTPLEKCRAILDFEALAESDRGAWLRSNGLTEEGLQSWKDAAEHALSGGKTPARLQELERANKKLTKELNRKEKALAEAAALIVLQKKVSELFGSEDES
jgi:transposase-like protein